jgi:hypothetical protein
MKPFAQFLMGFILFGAGFLIGNREPKSELSQPPLIECRSEDALSGLTFYVDEATEKNCERHPSFPGKLLCERVLVIECDLP